MEKTPHLRLRAWCTPDSVHAGTVLIAMWEETGTLPFQVEMELKLSGIIRTSADKEIIHKLCSQLIPSYEQSRFDVVAIRCVHGREDFVTFYLADKNDQSTTIPPGRFPVRKFKVKVDSLVDVYRSMDHFNLTLENPDYNMDDMEVMNR